MSRPVSNLRGRRFGRLQIPADAEPETRNGNAFWPTVCDCGVRKVVRATHLNQGRVVSCGCYRADSVIRKGAWRKVSAKRREQISSMGGVARAESLQ